MIKRNETLDRFKEDSINVLFYGISDKYGWAFQSYYNYTISKGNYDCQDQVLFERCDRQSQFETLAFVELNSYLD